MKAKKIVIFTCVLLSFLQSCLLGYMIFTIYFHLHAKPIVLAYLQRNDPDFKEGKLNENDLYLIELPTLTSDGDFRIEYAFGDGPDWSYCIQYYYRNSRPINMVK